MIPYHRIKKRAAQIIVVGLIATGASLAGGVSAFAQSDPAGVDTRASGDNLTTVDYTGARALPVYDDGSFGDNGPFS